jgi:hypothetical protein
MHRSILLIGLLACAGPVVRGERGYTATDSHYTLAPLASGEMSAPGWTFSTAGNQGGDPDFGFRHGHGTTDFFLVHGLPLRGDEPALPLPDLVKRWRNDLAIFGFHYARVFMPGDAVLSGESDPEVVPGMNGSISMALHYVWTGGSYDVYAAILRDPNRERVVVVMCGNDPQAFDASIAQADALAHRVHFEAP